MTDQTQKEVWIELKNAIGTCSECTHNNACIQMKTFVKHCFKAKYRFRCPIEVLDERTEE